MRLQLPAAVNMIIDVLQAHGYEAVSYTHLTLPTKLEV